MRIDVTYAGEPPRIIQTSGESRLSSSVMATSPDWRVRHPPVSAVMLRPRTDLVGHEGHGLVIELCAWSAGDANGRAMAHIDDLGGEYEVPRLLFHVFRVWEVLPADEVARAVVIEIDGRIHLRRVGDALLDVTAYERIEAQLLSQRERSERTLEQRVLLVHERLRWTHPDLDEEGIGDLYGLGRALHDYAVSMAGAEDASTQDEAKEPDDGLSELVSRLQDATGEDEIAWALSDAMLDDPDLTLAALERGCKARSILLNGLAEAWHAAMEDVDGLGV